MRDFHLFLVVVTFMISACFLKAGEQVDNESRRKEIQDLVALVTSDEVAKKDRPKVVQAILKLGELKAVEAAPQLAEKLDFHISETGIVRQDSPPPMRKSSRPSRL